MATQFETEITPCTILDAESPRIEQPSRIKIPLKQHQLALIHRCRLLENSSNEAYNEANYNIKTRIGIIGDVVGSGKTLSVLSLIETEKSLKTCIPKYYSNSYISFINEKNSSYNPNQSGLKKLDNTNVILVPHNIYKQWSITIETHTNLKYLGVFNKKTLDKFKEEESKDNLKDYDIILISSTKYKDVSYVSYNIVFSRLFIDEADSIKITGNILNSNFLWLVSSTYDVLCNPHGKRKYANEAGQISDYYSYTDGFTNYLYIKGVSSSIIKTFIYGFFCSIESNIRKVLVIKNDDEFIKQAFSLQDYVVNILRSKSPIVANVLGNFVSQDIMNHINGGDIQGAIELLNCKKISENFLIEAVTKDFEDKLKNKQIELQMKSQMTYSSENAKKESIDKIKAKIVDLEIKIDGIKSKLNDNNLCTICYDDIENKSVTMCCNTQFCVECITHWLSQKSDCPFCRARISSNNICVITDSVSAKKKEENESTVLPSKIKHLVNLINSKKDEDNFKMLIFSDYDNSFKNICDFLENESISYRRVIGTTATINKIVNNYKLPNSHSESIKILLLNAEYCASGINLENTSDIVIYHSMTPAKTKQIIGRGQRPGRTSQLNVWKLCYENES
jgi:hypothetical protein